MSGTRISREGEAKAEGRRFWLYECTHESLKCSSSSSPIFRLLALLLPRRKSINARLERFAQRYFCVSNRNVLIMSLLLLLLGFGSPQNFLDNSERRVFLAKWLPRGGLCWTWYTTSASAVVYILKSPHSPQQLGEKNEKLKAKRFPLWCSYQGAYVNWVTRRESAFTSSDPVFQSGLEVWQFEKNRKIRLTSPTNPPHHPLTHFLSFAAFSSLLSIEIFNSLLMMMGEGY